jgi:hypothetical protein
MDEASQPHTYRTFTIIYYVSQRAGRVLAGFLGPLTGDGIRIQPTAGISALQAPTPSRTCPTREVTRSGQTRSGTPRSPAGTERGNTWRHKIGRLYAGFQLVSCFHRRHWACTEVRYLAGWVLATCMVPPGAGTPCLGPVSYVEIYVD